MAFADSRPERTSPGGALSKSAGAPDRAPAPSREGAGAKLRASGEGRCSSRFVRSSAKGPEEPDSETATPRRAHRSGAASRGVRSAAGQRVRRAGARLGTRATRWAAWWATNSSPRECGAGPAVLARRPRRQHRDGLVGRDGKGLDLDQVVVEAPDQEAGVYILEDDGLD